MFKKSLVAVAVLGAAAFSAQAADVTMYGRIDTGLRYTNVDADKAGEDDVSKFEMSSGNYTGSRFGIKSTEDLGNGVKVGFVLESGFDSDDGTFDSNDGFFGREANLFIKSNFGEFSAGKVGILNSTAGSYGIGNFSAMGTGWGDVGNQAAIWGAGFSSRYENTLTYVTPEFYGFKAYAQYSFGENDHENKSSTDRYGALGVTYSTGALDLIGIVDTINKKSYYSETDVRDTDDTVRVTIGGSYDFGFVKPYIAAAYFKDGTISDIANVYKDNYTSDKVGAVKGDNVLASNYDGYGIVLGAAAPAFGGTFYGTLGYLDAEDQTDDFTSKGEDAHDMTRWMVGVGYDYPLSKRTLVYVDAGYNKDDIDGADAKPSVAQAAVGLVHKF